MPRRFRRTAEASVIWLALLGSVVVFAAVVALLAWGLHSPSSPGTEPIVVYVAAGLKTPVEAVARDYEQKYGVPVHLQYGGSQTLLANIEVSRRGDLYLPADEDYIEKARRKDLVDESIPLARMKPVLAVRKGNPKNLHSLADLLDGNATIAQANPDAAAVGQLTRTALQKRGKWDALARRTGVFKATVNDVANDLKVGAVDAGFVWDATVRQYPDLEAVPLPELENSTAHMAVGVLRSTTQPTAALRFARYLAAWDRGLVEFERAGFQPVDGDLWTESPEIRLLAGAMLRPAIEETITAFEQREGVRVTRVYNGCGILVAQMRSGQHPDAYFACDKSFMDQVSDLFLDSVDVSNNQLVILVPRANPHGIHELKDLGKPGLRVGVGHEKQCALGALTAKTLTQGGQHAEVMKNVVVQSPTGDLLVNQLRAGALDAIIAYVSNATAAGDELTSLPIDVPCAHAVQPLAVGKDSVLKYTTQRLVDSLRSKHSRERFESSGFHWQTPPRSK